MKLCDLKGERAIEVIADLIAPIANIAADAENLKLFNNKKLEGETVEEAGLRLMKEKLPILLKTHKKDIVDILCAVNGTASEDLSLMEIISQITDLANDKDFMGLFISAVNPAGRQSVTKSSEAAGPTEPKS